MTNRLKGSEAFRVLLLCAQTLLREGLRLLMAGDEDLDVAAVATVVAEAVTAVSRHQPDVLIVAMGWEGEDCTAVLQQLKSACPDLPLLVISPETRPEQVQAALTAGANGYLPLSADLDELAQAVFAVCRGEAFIHAAILPALYIHMAGQVPAEETSGFNDLSPRQREVLACLIRGLSDRDIAQELFISVRTVQTHLTHIYNKLGVHSRTEAAVMAVQAGWFAG
ncbi:MAG TPA: response regulator transcription factor [Anaerolineae bacterium]|nr:response regulator transcription factor [Anaerolineae bacterium]HIP73253.1 response regulator transcription factor [Anaerolineae bacterium]